MRIFILRLQIDSDDNWRFPVLFLSQRHQWPSCPAQPEEEGTGTTQRWPGLNALAVYMLGEAPGVQHNVVWHSPLSAPVGFLRGHIPDHWTDEHLRWSNVIRCRPMNEASGQPPADPCRIPNFAPTLLNLFATSSSPFSRHFRVRRSAAELALLGSVVASRSVRWCSRSRSASILAGIFRCCIRLTCSALSTLPPERTSTT